MDTLLIAVTTLSLLMAGAMAVIVTKLLADERRRSDARVAALADMAAADSTAWIYRPSPDVARQTPAAPARQRRPETAVTADLPLRPVHTAADRGLEPEPAVGHPAVGELFAQHERASAWQGRLAVGVALAVVVTGAGWALSRQPGAGSAAPASAQARPLELLSLRHTRTAESLTITGLVRNPPGAAPLTHVVATAVAFAPDGTRVASGHAPLDFITMGAGDETPFVVTIPITGAVARYRVGFRAQDGTVISHVDGRGSEN